MRGNRTRWQRLLPLVAVMVLATLLAPMGALARGPQGIAGRADPLPFGWSLPALPSEVVYDSTVTPLPGHLPSLGLEATGTSALGDEIVLAGDSRALQQVTVTLVSWACETGAWTTHDCQTTPGASFTVPLTLTLYGVNDNDRIGDVLVTQTQSFALPYQPSADAEQCASSGWFDADSGHCVNGLDANITFDFSAQAVQLPDRLIYGLSYDTSHAGAQPLGDGTACYGQPAGCPYDSLNVGLAPSVAVGSQAHPGMAYLDSTSAGSYCDGGAAGTGVFRLDSPDNACWDGFVPAVQITAQPVPGNGPLAWLFNLRRLLLQRFGR